MKKPIKDMVRDIEISKIQEPKGIVRMEIDQDGIKELAQSISEIGLLQPILLAIDKDKYEIVAGHRRYLAHKHIGLSKIKAVIKEMTNEEIGTARAAENINREDLTPIEEAATYKNLMDLYGMTLEKVAQKMGKSPGTIKRRMDLIKMPPALQKALHKKEISMSVAEELWAIRDQSSLDYYLIFAIENGCTKEVARQWAKDWKDTVRRSENPGVEGGQLPLSPFEPRPTYVPCDICIEPIDLQETLIMRVCKKCMSTIKKGMEVIE
jgi:ParB family chromosome partitioning protein